MKFIRPRWRKVIRDLWSNKSRTMLVVMAIAVGIFAVGVVSGSQETITRVLNESYVATNPASGALRVAGSFDDDLVATVNGMRDVEVAEGRIETSLRYKLDPVGEWQQMTLMIADDFAGSEIAKISGEAGEWPPPEKTLVIERASLDMMGVEISDTVLVETSAGKIREMEIAGTAHDLSGRPAALTGQPNGFITRDTLEWLGGLRNFNHLLFIVADNKTDIAHIETVGGLIEDKFQNEGLIVPFVDITTPGEHPINDVLEPLLLILTALSGLSLILSGLLVVNTISAMLAQQTRQIGMMKAIGARRGQIMALYFVMVFIYGLLALLIALPLGAVGAYTLTTFLLDFFNTDMNNFSIPTSVLAVQVAIGLLVPLVVAIYPILAGTRITVREAVSDYGVGKGKFGTSLIDRLLRYFRGISRPMIISLRNTFRRKGRLTLTLLTLTLAGTTFITIFSTRDSMMATLDDLMATFGFDAMILFDREYRAVELDRAIDQMPNIASVESWGQATVNRVYANGETSDDVSLESPPINSTMVNPDIVEGRWLQPDDANALVINTDFLDDEPDLKVGDEVVLELNSRDTTWQIVGVVQGTMFGSTVYANEPYFNRLTGNVGKSNMVRVALTDPTQADPDTLGQTLQEQFAGAGLETQQVMTLSEMQAMVETTFNFLISFLLAMAVVMAAVGGLGLSGTMSINVLERVREIGVMRAIGASDGAVLRLVLVEGIIIGILSWVAGAIVAVPLSLLISNLLGISLISQPLTYAYSIMGLGLWLVIAIILAAVASFFPARNASQLTVREVLAYE